MGCASSVPAERPAPTAEPTEAKVEAKPPSGVKAGGDEKKKKLSSALKSADSTPKSSTMHASPKKVRSGASAFFQAAA